MTCLTAFLRKPLLFVEGFPRHGLAVHQIRVLLRDLLYDRAVMVQSIQTLGPEFCAFLLKSLDQVASVSPLPPHLVL